MFQPEKSQSFRRRGVFARAFWFSSDTCLHQNLDSRDVAELMVGAVYRQCSVDHLRWAGIISYSSSIALHEAVRVQTIQAAALRRCQLCYCQYQPVSQPAPIAVGSRGLPSNSLVQWSEFFDLHPEELEEGGAGVDAHKRAVAIEDGTDQRM